MIDLFNVIWYARNQARFNDKIIPWKFAVSTLIANVSLSGNKTSKATNAYMFDFSIIKAFKVNIHSSKALPIKEVLWHPPIHGWVKCNIDGAPLSNHETSACGAIFIDINAHFLAYFAHKLQNETAFIEKLAAVMKAVEIVVEQGWRNLWIESDSRLVVLAFKKKSLVPW